MLQPSAFTDTVAYFSMEIGLDATMPTYSGGLGILAGDTLRAAADLGIPMVAVTLIHRKGYFRQELDAAGNQREVPMVWPLEEVLEPMSPTVRVTLADREVHIRAWRFLVRGVFGHTVPVYFLDTALTENTDLDRTLTDYLYGGDQYYRFCQEVVLGMGGVAMLQTLGYQRLQPYHMNEGHAALLTLALLEQARNGNGTHVSTDTQCEAVRQRCIFTTHTPVPAGHDQFPAPLVAHVLGPERLALLESVQCIHNGYLNMTHLALQFSRYVNGVAMRHGEVSRGMFPNHTIDSITNGVHALTWTAMPFRSLYDRHIPEWRRDNFYLRYAIKIPLIEIRRAHAAAKRELLEHIAQRTGVQLSENVFTLGFARRATAYKRADLLLTDLDRLRSIARQVGPLQVIYGGKAHPHDEAGKALVRRVFAAAAQLGDALRVVYMENYDMQSARHLCAGVDVWLNTPQRPQEASGTSGMKAALNGVPSFSVLDGWWIEGHVEGVTGWSIGQQQGDNHEEEVASLYNKLEQVILPLFYEQPEAFAATRRSAVALNGSFFHTQRMVSQYLRNAYFGMET